ncbi:MAG: lipocalin family protein [Gammaproteobacteria bacterium]
MNSRMLLIPVLAALALLAGGLQGCGQSVDSAQVGTYELDMATVMEGMRAQVAAIEDSEERKAMEMGLAMMSSGMLDNMNMSITLNADGTASSTSSIMGQSETVTGRWSSSGDRVRIEVAEGDQSEAVSGRITGDRLELFPPEEEDIPFRLVLIRQSR